jgi:hypothetical protein
MKRFYRQCFYLSWLIAFGLLLLSQRAALGLTAQLTVDSEQFRVGESVQMSIAVDGATTATRPSIDPPDGLSIQYLGPSTQVQIVNGKYTASVTYAYMLSAVKAGQYTLGPFRLSAGGKRITTNAITLEVSASGANSAPGSQGHDATVSQADDEGQLFLELEPTKKRSYLGERIPVTIRLYIRDVRVDDLAYPVLNQPEVTVSKFSKPLQKKVTRHGLTYQMLEFTSSITPVKTGSFSLGPATLDAVVRVKSRSRDPFFDDFFDDDYKKQAIQIKSKKSAFSVQSLPGNQPADFSGGIGRFQLKVDAVPTQCLQGDPITIRLRVSGAGNLDAIAPPVLAGKAGLKVYDPQKKAPAPSSGGGSVLFEQVVIPTDPRLREIGPFTFCYFDPVTGRYQQLKSTTIPVSVKANPNFRAVPQSSALSGNQPVLGKDLIYIKTAPGKLQRQGTGIERQPWFWGLQLLPLLGLSGAVAFRRHRDGLQSDTPQARTLRARREAERNLKQAGKLLETGQTEQLLELLCGTLRQWIGAQFNLPAAGITGSVAQILQAQNVAPETADRIREFFDRYDFFRFTGASLSTEDARQLLDLARRITGDLTAGAGSDDHQQPLKKVIR